MLESNPAKAATQVEELGDVANEDTIETGDDSEDDLDPEEGKAFEAAVAEAVKNIKRGKDGKYVLPKGLSAEVRHGAILEQRRRDTQSEFTKIAKSKKALEAENTALKNKAIGSVKITLTEAQAEELEELKFSDPEAWRKRMNKLEREALTKQKEELDTEMEQVSADILEKEELELRKEVLAEFNLAHPDFQLDDDVIQNEIPPRITKRLETGVITFDAFLQECYDYSKTGKVVKQDKLHGQPNLSRVGGGQSPDKHAETEDIILSYNKEIF